MRFLCQINILQGYEDEENESSQEEPPDSADKDSPKKSSHRREKSNHLLNKTSLTIKTTESEVQQLKFDEEFFIPPLLKQSYVAKAQAQTPNLKLNNQNFITAPKTTLFDQ